MGELSTRDKILNAMYSSVAEKGYDRTSISQICARVGITKPSLYYYFKSKEELFLEVVESLYPVLDPNDKEFLSIIDENDYISYVRKIGTTILASYHGDEQRRRVLAEIDMQAIRIPAVAQHQQRLTRSTINAFRSILQHGIDIGALPQGFDPHGAAQYLFVVISGFSTVVVQHGEVDLAKVWGRAVSMLLAHGDLVS